MNIMKFKINLNQKLRAVDEKQKEVEAIKVKQLEKLEDISGITSEKAKDIILSNAEKEVRHEMSIMIKEIETQAKEDAEKKSREIINSEELNEYDSMGRVTMSKDINGNSYTEYKYDFLGREINATTRTKIYNNLQSKKVKISEYDANGSLIKESEDGVTTEYKYDTINRLTEKAITNNQGTIVYNTDYSYEVVDN